MEEIKTKMKLRHIIRDTLIKLQKEYYKRILKKPRIYYMKESLPKSVRKLFKNKISPSPELSLYHKIRKNNTNFIILIQRKAKFFLSLLKIK